MIERATVIVTCSICGERFNSEVPSSLQKTSTICPNHSQVKRTVSNTVLKTIIEENFVAEVFSNGEAVWINKGKERLAKFNFLTREYKNPQPCQEYYTIYYNVNPQIGTHLYYAWEAFVLEVKKRFNVIIDDQHKPSFIEHP